MLANLLEVLTAMVYLGAGLLVYLAIETFSGLLLHDNFESLASVE